MVGQTGLVRFVNPFEAIAKGSPWTAAHSVVDAVVAVVALTVWAVVHVRSDLTKEDRGAAHMGRSAAAVTPAAIGYLVPGDATARAPYESTLTLIAGPGSFKSVGVVIPNVLVAPGT